MLILGRLRWSRKAAMFGVICLALGALLLVRMYIVELWQVDACLDAGATTTKKTFAIFDSEAAVAANRFPSLQKISQYGPPQSPQTHSRRYLSRKRDHSLCGNWPLPGKGNWRAHILQDLVDAFKQDDVILGDAYYSSFFLLAELISRDVDGVLNSMRHAQKTVIFKKAS